MKKNFYLIIVTVFIFACTPSATEEEQEPVIPLSETDVRFEFSTTKLTEDEIKLVYYEHTIDAFKDSTMVVSYDNNGNPLPVILNWENHGFRYLRGEIYRNNFDESELTVKIFVNNEEVVSETEKGTPTKQARVTWDYTIKNP